MMSVATAWMHLFGGWTSNALWQNMLKHDARMVSWFQQWETGRVVEFTGQLAQNWVFFFFFHKVRGNSSHSKTHLFQGSLEVGDKEQEHLESSRIPFDARCVGMQLLGREWNRGLSYTMKECSTGFGSIHFI